MLRKPQSSVDTWRKNVGYFCMFFLFCYFFEENVISPLAEPIVRNGRPPSAHSVHSFLHQYTGSFKKPPLRRPQSVIGGGLGSLMVMPRNGSRLGETRTHTLHIRSSAIGTFNISFASGCEKRFSAEHFFCVRLLMPDFCLKFCPHVD